MKRFFLLSITMLMSVALLMTACKKDKPQPDNSGNNGNTTPSQTIADNTLVYDGVTYHIDNVDVGYYHSELTLIMATTNDTLEDGSPLLTVDDIHISPNVWNRTYDMVDQSQWPDFSMLGLILMGAVDLGYEGFCNGGTGTHGWLDGVSYEEGNIFSSGTYRVDGNNDGTPITVTVDGTLINGKTLKMKLVSGNYEINEYKSN